MNIALILAVFTATVNLGTAGAHFAISRAPGWRSARAFSAIAFTAALYSLGNVVASEPALSAGWHYAAVRFIYVAATLHIVAWFAWLLGGPEGRFSVVPRPLRALALFALAATGFFAVTGLHLQPAPYEVRVPWAHVLYHSVRTTRVGDVYGYFLFALMLVPYSTLFRRVLRGERALQPVLIGFTVYLVCALAEVLVVNGNLVWLSPADLGFLAVIVPISTITLRRFVDDARRHNVLSGQLVGQVRDRTQERDQAQSALLESERLAALGQLAAGVGHEINNPLTYLQLALDRVHAHLDSAPPPSAVRRSLDDARDGAWRIQKVVEGLRAYSRRQVVREPIDLREVARNALKVARPSLRHVALLETQLVEVPLADGEEPRLVQALVNLLTNASQAVVDSGGNGHIRLCTGTTAAGEPYLEVEDDGPGIPEPNRVRLAEPYFTTRGPAGGAGLGLFVTRGVVDTHGGRIEFDHLHPHGTRVRLVLPPLPAEAVAAAAAAAARKEHALATGLRPPPPEDFAAAGPALPGEPRPRLLAIDDEPVLLRLMAQLLAGEWSVTAAGSGEEALRLLESQSFDAVLCDLMMPGLSGMEIADRVARLYPDLRGHMLFMTGGAITPEAEVFLARPDVVSVNKPMDFRTLRQLLRERLPEPMPGRG